MATTLMANGWQEETPAATGNLTQIFAGSNVKHLLCLGLNIEMREKADKKQKQRTNL